MFCFHSSIIKLCLNIDSGWPTHSSNLQAWLTQCFPVTCIGNPHPKVPLALILSKQFLHGEEQMYNPPEQCDYIGKVLYTALCSWEQSVVGNAGLWFTATTTDYSFVLWDQKPNKVLCEACDTPKPAVSAGLVGATQSWTSWPPFPLPLLLPLKRRCLLMCPKLIYDL